MYLFTRKWRSLITVLKRICSNTEPCGTPNVTEPSEEYEPWSKTDCIIAMSFKKWIHVLRVMMSFFNVASMKSNAFFRSKNTIPGSSDWFTIIGGNLSNWLLIPSRLDGVLFSSFNIYLLNSETEVNYGMTNGSCQLVLCLQKSCQKFEHLNTTGRDLY